MSAVEGSRTGSAIPLAHSFAPVLSAILAIVALACLAGVLRAAVIIPLRVSLDPNEGWNAYHAVAAMAGRGLYPAPTDFMVNNYPPLSFYLVGWLGTLFGDQILAGRIVSLVSFLIVCALVASILRKQGAGRQAALFAALVFAGLVLTASDYVGMDDPQLLGHAFQLAGAFLALGERRSRAKVAATAVLLVAGGFVKQNLFILPIALLIWLIVFDRRHGIWLVLCGTVLVVAGLLSFRAAVGTDLVARLNSARGWSLMQLWNGFANWLPLAAIPLCGIGAVAIRSREPRVAFVIIYAAIAVSAGLIMQGGAGVDVNAMFDADVALALAAGIALDGLLTQSKPILRIGAPLFAIACLVPSAVLAADNTDWQRPEFWLRPMHDEAALAAQDIAFLQVHPGPALCESLAYCYWAGKPASVDVFNLDQELRSGSRNPGSFLQLIRTRRFSAIELDETNPFPFPKSVEMAIDRNYRIDHADDEGTFFLPM